jgi:hypothetical protein
MVLYSHKDKFDSEEIRKHLSESRIQLKNYNEFENDLLNFKDNHADYKVKLDQNTCSQYISDLTNRVKDLNREELQTNHVENLKVINFI